MERRSLKVGTRAGEPQEGDPRALLYSGLFTHALHEVHIWQLVRHPDGSIATWRLVDANPAALRIWGRTRAEVVGRTANDIFEGFPATEAFIDIVTEIFETGVAREWTVEFPPTGEILHMVSVPLGEYFVSTGVDVLPDVRQARALEQALQDLEQVVRAGGVGLWDWDLTTNRIHYSDEWKRQLGYAPDEVGDTLREWESRVHPDDLESVSATVRHSIDTANQEHETVCRLRHKDGSYRWILSKASLVLDDEGTPIRMLGSHIDITERKRLEDQVREAQRLESVGDLAAGIAHDFNNMLTAIVGNVSLLEETVEPGTEDAEILQGIGLAAESARGLTSQLLTFAKGGAPVRQVVDIRRVIHDCAALSTRGTNAIVDSDISDDLAAVKVDVGQIGQVVNNLVVNAVQAMPDGGTVTVAATNVTLRSDNEVGLIPGRYVEVSVSDEGVGIPPENLARIFDLFFTTRSAGNGLGLATSYSIVSRHGGRIDVESEVGRGSKFRVYLPVSEEPMPVATRERRSRGGGKVLLMDDQDSVRSTVMRMLTRLGYECDCVPDGDAAVRRYVEAAEGGTPYDVVILDLTIPGRPGGRETLGRLVDVDPDVRAIVASGYADDRVLADYRGHGFSGRLRKPMTTDTLSAEMARVLARPP